MTRQVLIPGGLPLCSSEEGGLPTWERGGKGQQKSAEAIVPGEGKGRTRSARHDGMTQRGKRQNTRQLAFAWGEGGEALGDPGKGSAPVLALDREGALAGDLMEAEVS